MINKKLFAIGSAITLVVMLSVSSTVFGAQTYLNPIEDKTVKEGNLLSILVSAVSAERQTLQLDINPAPSGAVIYPLGDVSSNGEVSALDVTLIQEFLAKKRDLTETELLLADVNQDNLITLEDSQRILKILTDKLPPLNKFYFFWKPTFHQSGTYQPTFILGNNAGTLDTKTIFITVEDNMGPPELNPIGAKSFEEGKLFCFNVSASDPDHEALQFATNTLPSGSSIAALGDIKADGLTALDASLILKYLAGNLILNDVELKRADVNGDGIVTQEDAKLIIKSLAGEPLNKAIFCWEPNAEQAGNYAILFTVKDSAGFMDTEEVNLTVNDVKGAPTIAYIPPQTVLEGRPLTIMITAKDPDNDRLTFKAQSLPAGATFQTILVGDFNLNGFVNFADIAIGFQCIGTKKGDANFNPVCDLDNNGIITDTDTNLFKVNFGKSIQDPQVVVAGLFQWVPSSYQANTYSVKFIATDTTGLSDSKNVTITVKNLHF